MKVVLENIRSAQNVGSIIRTCDAFGIRDIYFCGITPTPENKKVLKTSLGAEKNINTHYKISTTQALSELKKDNELIALEITQNAIDIKKFKSEKNIVIVLGNEISGISDQSLSLCDKVLKIPMKGTKESLNVAVAFGIAAFELSQ
ncbi:MAG: TrmH family RNA methyltransferase [Patescibacteria group bacterium]|nr:TrmH family RNA methyltransferase [Patescibacteria group bacterium]